MFGPLSRWWYGECQSKARLDGKVAIITGCNTGIGKETARDFVRRGCRVIMACRDVEKANQAAEEIMASTKEEPKNEEKKCGPNESSEESKKEDSTKAMKIGSVEVHQLDLSSLDSVREFAKNILEKEPKIHLLVNNAGIMSCPPGKTKDGHEIQLGVNHLGHFLLTCLLLHRICSTPEARIINVSSMAHRWGNFDFDDMQLEKGSHSPTATYGRSKLANILFTKSLAKKLEGTGVNVYALHPGVVATELGRHLHSTIIPGASWFYKNVNLLGAKNSVQGAQTTIYCAVDEKTADETGLYYSDCKVATPSAKARDPELAERLWQESLKMVDLKEDPTLSLPKKTT
ncbi:retinol dehydrogenase 12-like [Ischnura elegans]|uniref:retinol dehydrogenase 12-like n=1 Tax=Ischnura elegans TaxID=197161 RepID=UPI001ED8BC76|nr:retinol dehydrogenase 12-like [Ischnura elegans]XP_046388351.1 retinol dehydrogenase 12-like [Ischnura elegans]